MFKSLLRRIFGRKSEVTDSLERTSWEYTDGFYVPVFKKHLDVIASAFSLEREKVYNLFSHKDHCAKLCGKNGNVLASVVVRAEMGTPCLARVTTFSLSKEERMLFTLILPVRVEFQEFKPF